MDGIKIIDQVTLSKQIKSIMIFEFLDKYNMLEKSIRESFETAIKTFNPQVIQQLYFYYGGKIGSSIEYETRTIKLKEIKYNENEFFKDFTTNQIIKIFKNTSYIEKFNFNIPSLRHPNNDFSFYDCVVRLLNMRNRLAHEVSNTNFKNSDLIELLSLDDIKQNSFIMLQNYDIDKMDDMTKYIASNIIYMDIILEHL